MSESIFNVLTPEQMAQLYFIYLVVTAIATGIAALIVNLLKNNKDEKDERQKN